MLRDWIIGKLTAKFGFLPDAAKISKAINAYQAIFSAGQLAFDTLEGIMNKIAAETGVPPLFGLDEIFSTAGTPSGLPVGIDKIKEYLAFGIDRGVSFLPLNTQSDYALLMGAGEALRKVIENTLPDGLSTMRDSLLGFLDHKSDLDSITHNRMYIPAGMQYLRFHAWTPVAFLPDSKLEFEFRRQDGVTAVVEQVLQGGLFHGQDYAVAIPAGFAGEIATLTIRQKSMGVTEEFLGYLQEAVDLDVFDNAAAQLVGGVADYVAGAFAGAVGGMSQLLLLDDLQFATTATGTPLLGEAVAPGSAVTGVTLAQVESLLDDARNLWLQIGGTADALATLPSVTVEVTDLTGAALAVFDNGVIRVDRDAAGLGWFVDATPQDSLEFSATSTANQWRAATASPAFARYDLLTVLTHELGHALGLDDIPVSVTPQTLMTGAIAAGTRRLPSARDLPAPETPVTPAPATPSAPIVAISPAPVQPIAIPQPGQLLVGTGPLAVGVTNGSFAVGDPSASQFGWTVTGDAAVTGGQGVLAEDDRFLSGLAQSFILSPRAEALLFTIVSADLQDNGDGPVDAFEVALLGEDDTPLAGTASLTGTDALFNLQSDGRAFAADRVSVSGLSDRNGGVLDTSRPVEVAINLAGLTSGAVASLFFDLIGFGETGSRVVIDDVRIVSAAGENVPPIAEGESATVRAGGAVVLDLLANDREPDGEPMTVVLVDSPAHGTLTDLGAGRYEYRPAVGYQGADAFTYRVSDGVATSGVVTVSLTVEGVNAPPQFGEIASVNVVEGGLATVVLSATDADGDTLTWSLVNPTVTGATIDAATGEFRWTATDGDASYEFTVRVSDGGSSTDAVLTVVVANVAPTLTVTGEPEALSGQPYTLALAAADPGEDTVTEWIIDWGDGSAVERVAGGTASASHVYAEPERTHTIQVSATDEDGTWIAAPREVAVVNDRLYVRTLEGGDSGFAIRFSRTFQQSLLNLYDTRLDPRGLPDLILRDASGNTVRCSVVVDADGQGLRFVATGGALPAGEYGVQLASRDNGFVDALGRTLDGNRDNVSGDDFVGGFTVTAGATLGIADLVRAPGQGVDVSATSAGIPISLTSDGGVTSVSFDLRYDPATLNVSVLEPGTGLPDASDVTATGAAGAYQVAVRVSAPLAAGTLDLLRVRASVPIEAGYGAARVLDIADVRIDGAVGRADDGVQVVALFGDSTGDRRYTSLDSQRVARIVAGIDTGLGFYPAIDPVLISDVDRSGTLTSADGSIITRESQFVLSGNPVLDQPQIPPLPNPGSVAGILVGAPRAPASGNFTVL